MLTAADIKEMILWCVAVLSSLSAGVIIIFKLINAQKEVRIEQAKQKSVGEEWCKRQEKLYEKLEERMERVEEGNDKFKNEFKEDMKELFRPRRR